MCCFVIPVHSVIALMELCFDCENFTKAQCHSNLLPTALKLCTCTNCGELVLNFGVPPELPHTST